MERWDHMRECMRVDGLSFDEAWRMNFTRRQRLGFIAAGTVVMALLLVGVMLAVWPNETDLFAHGSHWPSAGGGSAHR